MEFRDKQSIYLQIADYVCDHILLKKWPVAEKIISIRELAVLLQVNPNTVQRSYDYLQQKGIIVNKRGVGYFVDEAALAKIVEFRKEQFIDNEAPLFFRNMFLLKISMKELQERYDRFIKENFKS